MSATLDRVRGCVGVGRVAASIHGLVRVDEHGLVFGELLASVRQAVSIEDYPDAVRGPSVLALHRLADGSAVHVVWGFAAIGDNVAVLVTVYRPDPTRWTADFSKRRRR